MCRTALQCAVLYYSVCRTALQCVVLRYSVCRTVLQCASYCFTVCVVPASDDVPLTAFTLELQHALSFICHSLRLTSDIINEKLGSWAHERPNDYRLSSWLAAQEDSHRTVIYQCDTQFTPWTKRCIRQSDVILIVARADGSHQPGSVYVISPRYSQSSIVSPRYSQSSVIIPCHYLRYLIILLSPAGEGFGEHVHTSTEGADIVA